MQILELFFNFEGKKMFFIVLKGPLFHLKRWLVQTDQKFKAAEDTDKEKAKTPVQRTIVL